MTQRHRLPEEKIDQMSRTIHEHVVPEEPWEMCPGMHGDHRRLAHHLGVLVAPDTITRYFEAHITFQPDVSEMYREKASYEEFAESMTELGWRASKFEHDDVDGIAGKWFVSSRHESFQHLRNEVMGMVHGLSCNGTVERWKIEETLLDSKCGDEL